MHSLSIVISAPSGAGKSTIIREIINRTDYLDFAVSSTTRVRREGEIDGKDYHFISPEQFQSDIESGGFVEWAVVHGNYYGTTQKEIDRIRRDGKIPLFDVDVQGARSLKDNLYGAVFIFILPPSLRELEERLRKRRTDTDEQIEIRMGQARTEISKSSMFDYIVINRNVKTAVDDVMAVVRASTLKFEYSEKKIDDILGER
ncbi:MAG: guanylate kinase [Spirochaetota bacterium]